jgi:hypothetical protein
MEVAEVEYLELKKQGENIWSGSLKEKTVNNVNNCILFISYMKKC